MECIGCGAPIGSTDLICPFCGAAQKSSGETENDVEMVIEVGKKWAEWTQKDRVFTQIQPDDAKKWWSGAYMPTSAPGLVAAIEQCAPLIRDAEWNDRVQKAINHVLLSRMSTCLEMLELKSPGNSRIAGLKAMYEKKAGARKEKKEAQIKLAKKAGKAILFFQIFGLLVVAGGAAFYFSMNKDEGSGDAQNVDNSTEAATDTPTNTADNSGPTIPPTADQEINLLATAPDSGCTTDIGTHTVHNTAGDAKEPWLNLRASSNSDSEVLAKMPDGTCLTVLSENSSFWNVKVAGGSMAGTMGYAHKNYMKAIEKAEEPVEEVIEEPVEATEAAAVETAPATAASETAQSASSSSSSAPAPAAVKTGRVKVRSKPAANAKIYVDGAAEGSAPSTLTLNEGRHRIKLVGKSGKEKTFNVTVNPSSPTSICWNFKKSKNCTN